MLDDGGRAGDDRRVADGQRQTRRPRPEDARLVDHLELRRDGPLGEVDRDVGQPDADEQTPWPSSARGGHDHHLGLGERRLRHGPLMTCRRSCPVAGRGDHPVRPSDGPPMRRTASQRPAPARRSDGRSRSGRRIPSRACSMSGSANHSPMTGGGRGVEGERRPGHRLDVRRSARISSPSGMARDQDHQRRVGHR